jgi:hypothetical protein
MSNLLEKASIILTPTASNTSEVLCVKPSDGSGDFDFSRATDATRINSLGLVETIGINLPRINYEAGCGSWLFEPQSTNLCFNSNTFTALAGAVATPNAAISPDGTLNATKVNFSTGLNDGIRLNIGGVSASASTEYTFSFYAKNFSGDGTFNLRIDTDTDTLVTTANYTATSEWVRYTHTFTTDAAASSFKTTSRFRNRTDNNEVLFFGIQLEELTYATSYIPTSGSTVTRNQDVCTNGGSLASINSTEGVLYAEIAALANDGTIRYLGLSDGSSNNRVVLLYHNSINNIRAIISSGGTKFVDVNSSVTSSLDFHKVAIKYKLNDFALWIDGVEVATDTSLNAPIGLNSLDFLLSGANNFFGKTKALAVWKEALTDAELTELTTI